MPIDKLFKDDACHDQARKRKAVELKLTLDHDSRLDEDFGNSFKVEKMTILNFLKTEGIPVSTKAETKKNFEIGGKLTRASHYSLSLRDRKEGIHVCFEVTYARKNKKMEKAVKGIEDYINLRRYSFESR
ncbi:MAG: hypothetical protein ABIB71_03245 [Candidatus Woesearchaeota archaeon]